MVEERFTLELFNLLFKNQIHTFWNHEDSALFSLLYIFRSPLRVNLFHFTGVKITDQDLKVKR